MYLEPVMLSELTLSDPVRPILETPLLNTNPHSEIRGSRSVEY